MYKLTQQNKNIRDMFSSISGKYDFLNHLLSMNIDKRWRRTAVGMMDLSEAALVLDLATGTGDVAIEIMRQSKKKLTVIGVDFSQEMLKHAAAKTRVKKEKTRFGFVNSPAESLPLKGGLFDYCTIAFGIRNFADRALALKEIARVLKPGGRVIILEFSKPKNPIFKLTYEFYFFRVLPAIGGLFSKKGAYEYLPESVEKFPSDREFMDIMKEAGFRDVGVKALTLGIASIYTGRT